jgi:hypothetical protein
MLEIQTLRSKNFGLDYRLPRVTQTKRNGLRR